jgi:hypothetical protein
MSSSGKARVVVGPAGVVTVKVSAETLYNYEAIARLIPGILGPLGCQTCHSGRQLIFQQEEEEFSVG